MRKKIFSILGTILVLLFLFGVICVLFFVISMNKYLEEVPVIEPKQNVTMYQGDILYLEDMFTVEKAEKILLSTDNPESVRILEDGTGIESIGETGTVFIHLSATGSNSETRDSQVSVEIKEKEISNYED